MTSERERRARLASMLQELLAPATALVGYGELLRDEAKRLGFVGIAPDVGRIPDAARDLLRLVNGSSTGPRGPGPHAPRSMRFQVRIPPRPAQPAERDQGYAELLLEDLCEQGGAPLQGDLEALLADVTVDFSHALSVLRSRGRTRARSTTWLPNLVRTVRDLQKPERERRELIYCGAQVGRIRMGRPGGFFDVEERLAGLSKKGDDLERLAAVVDFERFRPELERAVPRADRSKGGRPPFDHVLMFKVLILQTQNNLSDERTEFYLRDRLTWMRFLGLGLGDPVPDANTLWTFREALTKAGAIEQLFTLFDQQLRAQRDLAMSGQLVDASIVAAPKQRNTKAEKQAIREGRVPEDWQDQPAKLSQKDRDARWTVKTTKAKPREGETPMVDLAIPEFGYQNHISADRRHRLIRRWLVTDAAAHAGARLADLLDPRQQRERGLGRHRLPFQEDRGSFAPTDAEEPDPPEEAGGPADAGSHRPGECEEVDYARTDRARVRRAEGQDGPVRPDHRPGTGDHQDRPRQPRPQHAPPDLAGPPAGARLTVERLTPKRGPPHPRNQPQPTASPSRALTSDSNSPESAVDGGVQVLGSRAPRPTFDQQSDRVGLILLPGGEARIAAGKGLDLGAVGRGNADTRPVAGAHRRGAGVQLPRPCRPASLSETRIALCGPGYGPSLPGSS